MADDKDKELIFSDYVKLEAYRFNSNLAGLVISCVATLEKSKEEYLAFLRRHTAANNITDDTDLECMYHYLTFDKEGRLYCYIVYRGEDAGVPFKLWDVNFGRDEMLDIAVRTAESFSKVSNLLDDVITERYNEAFCRCLRYLKNDDNALKAAKNYLDNDDSMLY